MFKETSGKSLKKGEMSFYNLGKIFDAVTIECRVFNVECVQEVDQFISDFLRLQF